MLRVNQPSAAPDKPNPQQSLGCRETPAEGSLFLGNRFGVQERLGIHARPRKQVSQGRSELVSWGLCSCAPPGKPFAPEKDCKRHHPHEAPRRQRRFENQSDEWKNCQQQPSTKSLCPPNAGGTFRVVKQPASPGLDCIIVCNFSIHRNLAIKKYQPPRRNVLRALSPSLTNFTMTAIGHRRICKYQEVVVSKKSCNALSRSSV